jgi:hypothetical protein
MTKNELIATSMLASAQRTPIPFSAYAWSQSDSWVRDLFLRDEEPGGFTGLNVRFAASEASDEASIWVVKWDDDEITQL